MRLTLLLAGLLLAAPPARGTRSTVAVPAAQAAALRLGPGVSLALPPGFRVLAGPRARQILTDIGNVPPKDRFALVSRPGTDWFVEVAWVADGHVRDDDAEALDATALLAAVRDDTTRANAETARHGFSPLRVDGWAEQPRYDRAQHRLLWSVALHDDRGMVMNLGARLLGRHGYVRLNLAAAPGDYPAARRAVARLIDATAFDAGSAYDDFRPGTDGVAAYGLRALVAGTAPAGG